MLNRDALRDLYDYTDFTWAVFINTISNLSEGSLATPAPGSGWPTLLAALRHIVDGYDGWLHEVLRAGPVVVPQPDAVTDLSALADWRTKTRVSCRRLLDDTPDAELFAQKTRVWEEFVPGGALMSTADILAHVLLHERGHHGDLNTLLYQLGTEQPMTDYGIYLLVKKRREGGT